MTTVSAVPRSPGRDPDTRQRTDWLPVPVGVLLATLAVAVGRLPFVNGHLGQDEAGYLAVARQWQPGGTALYGNYWVDRPPLLVTIFRAAALMGGTVPLRLIGIGAAAVVVLAVGWTADRISGGRAAATWASVAAAAFLLSPATGATEVNGELLAAPFVAVGVAGAVHALRSASRRDALVGAGVAGAAAFSAILVKQNMLDVLVFTATMAVCTVPTVGRRRLADIAGAFSVAGAGAVASVAGWTVAHGTSLPGVWFAMYQFRVEATKIIAASGTAPGRRQVMLTLVLVNGMAAASALLMAAVALAPRDHPSSNRDSQVRRAILYSLAATVTYDAVSIYLGGNYWSHYLVQLVVPLALGIGLTTARRPRAGHMVACIVAGSSLAAIHHAGPHPMPPKGTPLGAAIARVAHPGDTIITVWGHSEVTEASGLRSPYPYLWYLPERTLDPRLTQLTSTLVGPHAPTWFVSWAGTGLQGVDTSGLNDALSHDYHRVATINGTTVYLHSGAQRAGPSINALTGD
jgi:hypothetical protein